MQVSWSFLLIPSIPDQGMVFFLAISYRRLKEKTVTLSHKEFIALIADKLQLQLKSSEVANF
jgi:hypothetical protein